MSKSSALAAAIVLSAGGAYAPIAQATSLEAFSSAFGEDGARTLSDCGYILLQGQGSTRRLSAVHWKALESLAAAAPSCHTLAGSAQSTPAAAPDLGINGCRALPPTSAMTPRLHALAAAVAAENEERWALSSSSTSLTEPTGIPNLFDTPWGQSFAARRRADRIEDPAPLAKIYFEDFLSGPRPNPEAVKHFLAVTEARGVTGAEAKLTADSMRGTPGDELKVLIRYYLQDERRRHGLMLARERLRALMADKETRRQLEGLATLSSVLNAKPNLLSMLEKAFTEEPLPAGPPRLRSAGVHLQEPTRLEQYELGDQAFVSGAYWVDGLPEGATAEIDETTYIETPLGFTSVETKSVKRRNGGPYAYSRTFPITSPRAVSVVTRISAAAGTLLSEKVEIPIASDFEIALKHEADVLQAIQSCDFKTAESAAQSLADLIADAAKVKPQYKALLARAYKHKETAMADAAIMAKLEEVTAESREDSSPQVCRFDPSRTEAALKLARKLPAGCDRSLPELFAQRSLIQRRAVDQSWFMKASQEARSRRRSCDFEEAANRWTQALAVLEADPAARCGKVAEEAKVAEAELATTRRSHQWNEELAKTLDRAESESLPIKRIEILAPAFARLNSLEDRDCRRDQIKRALRLAEKAGEVETGPADADALRRLPDDSALASIKDDVRRARAKLLEKSDSASAPTPVTAAPAVEPKKTIPAKPKTK